MWQKLALCNFPFVTALGMRFLLCVAVSFIGPIGIAHGHGPPATFVSSLQSHRASTSAAKTSPMAQKSKSENHGNEAIS